MRTVIKIITLSCVMVLACWGLFGCSAKSITSSVRLTGLMTPRRTLPQASDKPSAPARRDDSIQDREKLEKVAAPDTVISEKGELLFASPWGKAGWAHTWGAESEEDREEYAYDVALGNDGGVYVTGNFAGSADFSAGQAPQGYNINSWGEADIFITKFDADGDFQWACGIGGEGWDEGRGVATDSEGCVYIAGFFSDEFDFDPHVSKMSVHGSNGGTDVFLSKWDKLARHIWTRTWGGTFYDDEGLAVAVDGSDNVFVTGYFGLTVDFNPGSGTDTRTSKGSTDVFISKFNTNGTHQWTRTLGGNSSDVGFGVAADDAGNVYVTGYFHGANVDLSAGQKPGGELKTSNGGADVFLVKFGPDGGFLWSGALGADEDDYGYDVAVCPESDNVYVAGHFMGTVHFPAAAARGGYNKTSNGKRDGFLCKIGSNGNMKWARTFGGPERDQCLGVAVDGSGDIYTAGFFSETVDFSPQGGHDYHTAVKHHDCFISKYSPRGNRLWTHTWGSHIWDECFGVAADPLGGAYATGVFSGTVNFATAGFGVHTAQGVRDIFLCSFPPDGNWGTKLDLGPVFMKIED